MNTVLNTLHATALFLALAAPAVAAGAPPTAPPMRLGAEVAPPSGFVDFCRRQPFDCGGEVQAVKRAIAALDRTEGLGWSARFAAAREVAPASTAGRSGAHGGWAAAFAQARDRVSTPAAQGPAVRLDRDMWTRLNTVNSRINRAILRRSDLALYGREDVWATPLETGGRFGDCEDYALEKRRALIAEGTAPEALNLALVTTRAGEAHAVLLVATSQGELVLDNLSPWVTLWSKTDYRWRERQVDGGLRWARISDPAESRFAQAF